MKKIEKKRKKKPAAAFMCAYYIRVGGDLNPGEPRHADVVKSCSSSAIVVDMKRL